MESVIEKIAPQMSVSDNVWQLKRNNIQKYSEKFCFAIKKNVVREYFWSVISKLSVSNKFVTYNKSLWINCCLSTLQNRMNVLCFCVNIRHWVYSVFVLRERPWKNPQFEFNNFNKRMFGYSISIDKDLSCG